MFIYWIFTAVKAKCCEHKLKSSKFIHVKKNPCFAYILNVKLNKYPTYKRKKNFA